MSIDDSGKPPDQNDPERTKLDPATKVDDVEALGNAPTRIESTPTPPPGLSRPGGATLERDLSLPVEDLLGDRLLSTLPRVELNGKSVPAIGDISLISKLGQGGMGAVYLGYKTRLRRTVAVKVLPMQMASMKPELADRFVREAQLAASIESPHLTRVSDVNEEGGLFYFVMEYVSGISAGSYVKQLVREGKTGLPESEALDLCIAATRGLVAAHVSGIIHRDLKPDNILIPRGRDGALRFQEAKLADLGLARSEELGQTITATQIGMGTPGYMAPEQALSARRAGKPADVFSMGATLYALLAGHSPFKGDSSTAVIMATIQEPHRPINELRPGVTAATARLIDICLEKEPERRFVDAVSLLEALEVARASLTEPRSGTETTKLLSELQLRTERGAAVVSSSPAVTVAEIPSPPVNRIPLLPIAVVVIVLISALAIWLAMRRSDGTSSTVVSAANLATPAAVRFGIAYSSEKDKWIKWAAGEFTKTEAGRAAQIDLLPMSEQQAENALLASDRRIHAWAPASSIFRSHVEAKWQKTHSSPLAAEEGMLSLSPHVFVMYESRYNAFRQKYGELTFQSLRKALDAGTWKNIASKPEWGDFTFAVTDPVQYNNGLSAVCLMAAEFQQRPRKLEMSDVSSDAFLQFVKGFQPAFDVAGNPSQAMIDFVLRGPSAYDGVFTHESIALSKLEDAADRWEPVRLVYPPVNIWNDARYYVLDAPWSSAAQRKAASDFLAFLLSEKAQRQLVLLGFRPADPDVRIRFPESLFVTQESKGARLAVPIALEMPSAEVVDRLVSAVRK